MKAENLFGGGKTPGETFNKRFVNAIFHLVLARHSPDSALASSVACAGYLIIVSMLG
jgi:hypothetical protein